MRNQVVNDLTNDQRKQIRELINQYFDVQGGYYLDSMSDQELADGVGVPVSSVIEIREAAFGKLIPAEYENSVVELRTEIFAKIAKMQSEATASFRRSMQEFESEIISKLDAMTARFNAKIIGLTARIDALAAQQQPTVKIEENIVDFQTSDRRWTPEKLVWIINHCIKVDGDLASARRIGDDTKNIAAFNRRFGENLADNGGAWRAKTNSIREWNTWELLNKQAPEVLEALRNKGWNGRPSSRKKSG